MSSRNYQDINPVDMEAFYYNPDVLMFDGINLILDITGMTTMVRPVKPICNTLRVGPDLKI